MEDAADRDNAVGIVDVVQDAIVADPQSPAFLVADKLPRTWRPRVFGQAAKGLIDSLEKIPGGWALQQCGKIAGSGRRHYYPVRRHHDLRQSQVSPQLVVWDSGVAVVEGRA